MDGDHHAGVAAERWERRPRLAAVVQAVIVLAPALLATAVTYVVGRELPRPHGVGRTAGWWMIVIATSALTVVLFERLFRRLVPLTVMLNVALVFPGVAPSRFSSAFRAGTVRNLERRIEEAKQDAEGSDTTHAASTVIELVAALGAHDPKTRGHSERTRTYSDLISEELGLSDDDRDRLRWSALLHDVGKLHVHSAVLNKAGKPSDEEWELLRTHPIEGARVAAGLRDWLGPWALAIEQHHEKFDGTGYPKGLIGEQISLGGRIVAVGDAYDVMTSARSYSKPVSSADARAELVRCAGSHFDPDVVRAFLRIGVSKLPGHAGLVAAFVQLPWFLRLEQLVQNGGSALVAGTAVATLAITGVVAPDAAPTDSDPAAPIEVASGAQASTTQVSSTLPGASVPGPAVSIAGVAGTTTTAAPAARTSVVASTLPTATTGAPPPASTTTTVVASTTFYLGGTASGQPATPSDLRLAAPGGSGAPDYDGDGAPGRSLAPSPQPLTTTDPGMHQLWVGRFSGAAIVSGTPKLEIFSAVSGFTAGRGDLRAVLLDCDGTGGGTCTRIATASLSEADWSGGSSTFRPKSLTFTAANHPVAAGRTLVLRVGVQNGSQPLLIAYGTSTYPASLAVVSS
jgi:hypothetical protein